MPGMRNTMREFKAGTLRSGSKTGPVVTNPKQAIAIGLSELEQAPKRAGLKRRGYAMGGRVIERGERAAGIQRVADDD